MYKLSTMLSLVCFKVNPKSISGQQLYKYNAATPKPAGEAQNLYYKESEYPFFRLL